MDFNQAVQKILDTDELFQTENVEIYGTYYKAFNRVPTDLKDLLEYGKTVREWDEFIVYEKEKERNDLDKKIKETQRRLPGIIYSLVDKKFILLTLKDKSNISLYIDIYTGCERLYNKTPSAFLLEWNK